MLRSLAILLAAPFALCACRTGAAPPASATAAQTPADQAADEAPTRGLDSAPQLDPAWGSMPILAFETYVQELAAEDGLTWEDAALESLTRGLEGHGMRATRAALLLAHDPREATSERLVAALERRHVAPTRGEDAGDIVAAAALGRRILAQDHLARLEALAAGDLPHPDLEVRIEIAAAIFGSTGPPQVGAFLVRVLRAETPAQLDDPRDWERMTTLAWAKTRAAAALNRALGLDLEFRPDGTWAHQAEVAQAFAEALSAR